MSLETIEAKVKADLSWLQRHEKLVLAVIAGLVLWFGIGKIDTLIANHDHANLSQAAIVAGVQAEKNAALAAQVAEQAMLYKELADKVQAQNAALEQANVNLANALIKQQRTDATMTDPQLAIRWLDLVPSADPLLAAPNGGLIVTHTGAVATVQRLEEVPVLKTELSNTNGQLANVDKLLTASTGQVATLNGQVTGLQLQIVDNSKVCTAQIAVVKADARKSKRRWFYAGMVVGFVGRQLIKTYAGL